MAGPGDQMAVRKTGQGRSGAAYGHRDRAIAVLKASFVAGRLDIDEFDVRVGQALASRSYAELAAVTADLPDSRPEAQAPRATPRWLINSAVRWGASGLITPALLAAAFAVASLAGDVYGAVAFLIAAVYFLCWLSTGASMLWEWHSMSLPATGMCVRCGHAGMAHRAPEFCAVRLGSLNLWTRCPCAGYVPPGVSPQTVEPVLLPAGYP
jgi:hypothetical protein